MLAMMACQSSLHVGHNGISGVMAYQLLWHISYHGMLGIMAYQLSWHISYHGMLGIMAYQLLWHISHYDMLVVMRISVIMARLWSSVGHRRETCLLRGYRRAGTHNDRLGESFPTVRRTCLYSYGPYSYGLYSYGLYSYDPHRYGAFIAAH